MAYRPRIVRIPGFRLEKIATVDTAQGGVGIQKRTPEWMVSFSTLSKALLGGTPALQLGLGEKTITQLQDHVKALSSVEKLGGFTEVFGWFSEVMRYINGHVSANLLQSGSVKNSPLVLMIPAGTAAATLEEAMFGGRLIHCITLIRIGYVCGILQLLQAVLFQSCRIERFQQQLDQIIIHCNIIGKTNLINVFDQTGKSIGVGVSHFELHTVKNQNLPPPL